MKYGQKFESLLRQSQKSRSEFGAAIGCGQQNISQLFSDARGTDQKLTLEKHFKAAEFLGVDPVELYTGDARLGSMESGFSSAADELAILYDMIPAANRIARAQAYNAASAAIIDVLQRVRSENQPQPVDLKRLTA